MAILLEVFRLIFYFHIYFDLSVYGCPIGLLFRVSKKLIGHHLSQLNHQLGLEAHLVYLSGSKVSE